jgi:hypothetical protein
VINVFWYVINVMLILIMPLLAYFNFKVTALESDYWTQRYLLLLVYMILEVFPFGAIDNFVLLMADGIILSQIVSVYMYN